MSYPVLYHPDVTRRDIPRLSSPAKIRIQRAIESKLMKSPEDFGEPLRRTLKGYWKLRVGDYRVIFKVQRNTLIILCIGHRREVYEA